MQFQASGRSYDGVALWKEVFAPERERSYHPGFVAELRHILTNRDMLRRYVRHTTSLFELARMPIRGSRILDCGAGFGATSIILALLGAREVHGLEYLASRIATFRLAMEAMPPLPVVPVQGDAADLPYRAASFDAILSVEAISHYRNTPGFLAEAARVLRPGGKLIISDANNGANPYTAWFTHRIWNAFENGPATDDFHGHPIPKPFVERRKEIIQEHFPEISPEEAADLARRTSGMARKEIVEAVQRYLDTGVKPDSFYRPGMCPVDPVINHHAEFLFHPLKFSEEIASHGFDVEVYSYFGGSRGGWVEKVNDLISHHIPTKLTIWAAKTFRIVATRK
jgi:SAM-dependent methyltransferase